MVDWVEYCNKLLTDNGLHNWTTVLSRGKRTIGLCVYAEKTIRLSKYHLESDDPDYIKDTIIHEVAHALNPRDRHGEEWRRTATRLGGTGDQYAKHSDYPSKWLTMCANGHNSKLFRWDMKTAYSCRKCGTTVYIRRSDGTEITLPTQYVDEFNHRAKHHGIPQIDRHGVPQL